MRALWGVLLLLGCGPSFTGSWQGSLLQTGGCTDSSGGTKTNLLTWTLLDRGGTITVTPEGGTCGSFVADAAGNRAELRQTDCPTTGAITNNRLSGVLLLTSADLMHVCLETDLTLSNGGRCTASTSGTMQRRP